MSMAYDQQKDVLYYSMSNGAIQRMYNPMHANRRDEYILTAGEPTELTLSYCHRYDRYPNLCYFLSLFQVLLIILRSLFCRYFSPIFKSKAPLH